MPRVNTGLKEKDFQDGKLVRTDIADKSIVIGMMSGKLYAMDSVCSHEGGPRRGRIVDGYNLTCPWHQGIFDIRNAKASPETSWVTDLKSYPVVVDEKDGEITAVRTNPSGSSNLQNHDKSVRSQQTTVDEEIVPTIPLNLELKLLDKIPKNGTDVMSFKFSKSDDNNHLNYRAGQFAIVDLGTKEDPKGPYVRSPWLRLLPRRCNLNYHENTDSPSKRKLHLRNRIRRKNHLAFWGNSLPDDHSNQ